MRFFQSRVDRLKGKLDVPRLVETLDHRKPDIRKAAASALGEIKDERAVEPLLRIVAHESATDVTVAAIEALSELSDVRSVEGLIQATEDKRLRVRKAAACALGEIKDARAVEPLIRIVNCEAVSEITVAAVEALAEISDVRSVEGIIEAAKDSSSEVREAALRAMEKLGNPAVDALLRELLLLLKNEGFRSPEPWARDPVITDIAEFLRFARSSRPGAQLLDLLKEPRASREVIIGLGLVGERRSVEPLLEKLDHHLKHWGFSEADPQIETNAIVESFGFLGDFRGLKPLLELLKLEPPPLGGVSGFGQPSRPDRILTFLGYLGDRRALEPLVAKLRDPGTRMEAASSLGRLGDPCALETLQEIAEEAARKMAAIPEPRNQSAEYFELLREKKIAIMSCDEIVGEESQAARREREAQRFGEALRYGIWDEVRARIEQGADFNAFVAGFSDLRPDDEFTALMAAANAGNAEMVRYLLGKGARIDSRTSWGSTALLSAVPGQSAGDMEGYLTCVQLLLDAGANPRLQDEYGVSPVSRAREYQHWQLLELLEPGRQDEMGTSRAT